MTLENGSAPGGISKQEHSKGKIASWARFLILMIIIAGLAAATVLFPIKNYITSFLEWIQNIGIWGPVVVAAFYIVACVLFFPGSVITLGAGFLFGMLWGTITVSIGSTLGACAAFVVGRTIARNWIADKVAGNQKFAAIDKAVGTEGFKIVLLTRLSPVFPFNLLNYAFGLTKISFRHYALASWIGMIPATVMYVYFGSTLRSLTDVAAGNYDGGTAQTVFFYFGLGVTIAVTIFVTRVARRALKEAVER